jgi:hypothetical protein
MVAEANTISKRKEWKAQFFDVIYKESIYSKKKFGVLTDVSGTDPKLDLFIC